MSVLKQDWGYFDGYTVNLFTLKNEKMTVRLTNFGAAVVGIDTPDRDNNLTDIVLGYDNLDGYVRGLSFQGAVIGRYANRIGGAAFELNGKTYTLPKNDGENCLHGGDFGFNRRVFEYKINRKQNSVSFRYRSPDGECGFPCALDFTVKYTLTSKNKLRIKYEAVSNGDTVFNPTNHAYFNLKGKDSVLGTVLQIRASKFTPFNKYGIPTGEIKSVKDTPFDFMKPKKIGTDITGGFDGYDHNFLFKRSGEVEKVAVAHEPESGRIMAVYTDMPAMQLYTANGLGETGKGGVYFGKHHAFCLETQFTPNSPNLTNNPDFPSCVLKKGKKFKSVTIYAFGVK